MGPIHCILLCKKMVRFYPFAYHLHEDSDRVYILLFAYDSQWSKIAIRFSYSYWFYVALQGIGYGDVREILERCSGVSLDDPSTVQARYSTKDLHRPRPVIKIRCNTSLAKRSAMHVLGESGVTIHEADDKLDPILKFLAERGIVRYQWMEAQLIPVVSKLTVWDNEYEGIVETLVPVKEEIQIPDLSIFSWDIETNSANWNKFPTPKGHPDNYITMIGVTFWTSLKYEEHILIYGPEIEAPSGPSMEARGIKVHTFPTELSLIRGFLALIRALDPDILVGHNIFDFDIPYVTGRYAQLIMNLMQHPDYKGPRNNRISNISRLKSWDSPTRPVEWNNSQVAVSGSYVDVPGRVWLDTRIVASRNLFGPLKDKKLNTIGQVILGMPKNDMPHKEMFRIFKFYMELRALNSNPDLSKMTDLESRVRTSYVQHTIAYNQSIPSRPRDRDLKMADVIGLQSMANILDQRGAKRKILMAKDVPTDREQAKEFLEAKYAQIRAECESLATQWNIPLEDGIPVERMIMILWWFVAMYCLQDTRIPFQALQKQSIVPVLREQGSIFAVEMADVLLKGQIHTTTCAQYSYAYRMGFMMDFGSPGGPTGPYEYEGGFVAECNPGLKVKDDDSIVFVLDFASLYPTVIIAHGICYTTWVPVHMRNPEDEQYIWKLHEERVIAKIAFLKAKTDRTEEEIKHLMELEQIVAMDVRDRGKAMCFTCKVPNEKLGIEQEHWYLKPCILEGILPHMLWKQYLARREIKAKMAQAKKAGNTAMAITYDAQQLAIKISMNSSYGGLGTASNRLANYPAAETTTYLGRECIQTCNAKLIEWGEDVAVYNDTDSAMILVPRITERFGRDPDRIRAHGHAVAKRLGDLFPRPMGMECENFFISFLLKAKKNYAAIKWDGSSLDIRHYTWSYVSAQGLLYIKGLAPVRNDKFGLCKKLMADVLYMLLARVGHDLIIQRLERSIEYIWSFSRPGAITRDNLHQVVSLFSYNMGLTPDAYRGNKSPMSGWANKYAALYGSKPKPGEKFELVVSCPQGPITKAVSFNKADHSKTAERLAMAEWLLDPAHKCQLDIIHYLLCFQNDGNIVDLIRLAYPDETPKTCITGYYIPILIEQGHIPNL